MEVTSCPSVCSQPEWEDRQEDQPTQHSELVPWQRRQGCRGRSSPARGQGTEEEGWLVSLEHPPSREGTPVGS